MITASNSNSVTRRQIYPLVQIVYSSTCCTIQVDCVLAGIGYSTRNLKSPMLQKDPRFARSRLLYHKRTFVYYSLILYKSLSTPDTHLTIPFPSGPYSNHNPHCLGIWMGPIPNAPLPFLATSPPLGPPPLYAPARARPSATVRLSPPNPAP